MNQKIILILYIRIFFFWHKEWLNILIVLSLYGVNEMIFIRKANNKQNTKDHYLKDFL